MGGLRARLDVEGVGLPFLLALLSVLGFLQLLDVLGPVYYPMVHRTMWTLRFELGVSLVAPLLVLLALWLGWTIRERRFKELFLVPLGLLAYPLLGVEGFVSALSLLAAVSGLWFHRHLEEFFTGVFALLGGFETLALLHWVFFVPLGLSSPLEGVAWVEMGLFYLASYLAPLLVLPLLFMWVLKPLLHWILRKNTHEPVVFRRERDPSPRSIALFLFSIFLSVVASLYPYCSAVNPNEITVGVDTPDYVEAASLVEKELSQVFNMWGGSRPVIFIVIYGFQRILGSDVSTAVNCLPVILNPLMIVAVFFLSFEVFGDWWLSSWSAFFTACGYQITVGMYSFYLTNMLALSLTFLSFGFLFRSIRRSCNMSLAIASILGVLLVFTHPWTFNQYAAATFLTIVVSYYRMSNENGSYESIKRTIIYLVSVGLADLFKTTFFHGVGAVSSSSAFVGGISGLPEFWLESIFSFRHLYGGTISVVVLIGLAVLGVYLFEFGEFPGIYFTVFLAVTSLPFLFGDNVNKSRLLYNVPIGLFAAIGMSSVHRWKVGDDFKKCFTLFVTFSLVVYLIRSLANLI